MTSTFNVSSKKRISSHAFKACIRITHTHTHTHTYTQFSMSTLHVAAGMGNVQLCKTLIESGLSPDVQLDTRGGHREGETPLHFAAVENRADVARVLLESGADIYKTNMHGLTAMHVASGVGHVNVMREILQHGFNATATRTENSYESLPVHLAATSGKLEAVELLVNEYGSPVDVPNSRGNIPLHGAAMSASVDTVAFLVRQGSDLTSKNDAGKTPLEAAESVLSLLPNEEAAALKKALPEIRDWLSGNRNEL